MGVNVTGRTHEEAEANALLIAAAPDLLEATLAALSAIAWAATHTSGNAIQFAEVDASLRAAIAKAEGREEK